MSAFIWVTAPAWERLPVLQEQFPHDVTVCAMCGDRVGAMLVASWSNPDVDSEAFVGFYAVDGKAVCEECGF